MPDSTFYQNLAEKGLNLEPLDDGLCLRILESDEIELLPLVNAAYTVRRHFTGKEVMIHIINNAQNGFCPEDCRYCAQAKTAEAGITEYPMKSEEEILEEARLAYEQGACRYCMVFAGRGPSERRIKQLCRIIRTIKERFPLEVCVSPGLLDRSKAKQLKKAGLDRLNHNLNTSPGLYPSICTTHTYEDRIQTLKAAGEAGLEVCSGVIIGMGEESRDIIELARNLRGFKARSIPVNFLIKIDGTAITPKKHLTPEFCLRVLCLFRFLNPDAEIRAAAGRELHLRSLQVLCLYPANSIFLDGYLNVRGSRTRETLQMIRDAGFTVKSARPLDDLIRSFDPSETSSTPSPSPELKDLQDLRVSGFETENSGASPAVPFKNLPDLLGMQKKTPSPSPKKS